MWLINMKYVACGVYKKSKKRNFAENINSLNSVNKDEVLHVFLLETSFWRWDSINKIAISESQVS